MSKRTSKPPRHIVAPAAPGAPFAARAPATPRAPPPPLDAGRRWVWLAAACVLLTGAAAYVNSLGGLPIFDDVSGIVENTTIRSLWPPWRALRPPTDTPLSARPLTNFTLAVNYALGGENTWGYHVFNVAIHVLAALALFGIVRRTLSSGRLGPPLERRSTLLAGIVAMIWMLHPIQTESVSYIVQRTESLMGLMYLLTLYCAVRGMAGGGWGWYAASAAACAMGMACKEVMVSAPLMVLLYDRALSGGTLREALRRRWRFYLALACTWGALAASMLASTRGKSAGFHLGISSLEYLRTQAGVILHYLRVGLWPDEVVLDYHVPIARSPGEYLPQGAAVLVLLAATGLGVWRNRPWGLLGAWFFLVLAPSSSFVPVVTEIAAEHRMYLPLAALVCGGVLGAFSGGVRLAGRPSTTAAARRGLAATGAAAALAAIGALGYLTFQRNWDYGTNLTIWTDTVRKQPDNVRALCNLGVALEERRDFRRAMDKYKEALRVDPNDPTAMNHAGSLLVSVGEELEARHDPAAARERFQEALPYFDKIIAAHPEAASPFNNRGVALMHLGRDAEALGPLRRGVEIDGDGHPAYRHNLATALSRCGMLQEARQEFDRAIALAPEDPQLYEEEAGVLVDLGLYAEAADRYRTALRLHPGSLRNMNRLAWILATCPADSARNGREALAIAQRVCALPGGRTSDSLAVLAAAYAEIGDFALAVQTIQSALAAASSGPKTLQDLFRKHLESYRSGRPWRQAGQPGG